MQKELPSKANVVIIGSGVIGAGIACQLIKRGIDDVVVLEQGEIGAQGATSKCIGGLRTQFSTAINIRFSLISREVFRNFKEQFGIDLNFRPYGYLFLATREKEWSVLLDTSRLMTRLKTPLELFTPQEVAQQWPFLDVKDIVGGSYTKDDGFYDPHTVLWAYVKKARLGGAVFIEGVKIGGVLRSGKKITGVETTKGHQIKTEFVVNAAGPWAGQVAALAGLDLPIGPLRRHLFFTDTFEEIPDVFPMVFDLNSGWYMKREGKGLILGGPSGERSFSNDVNFDAEEWTAIESIRRVPALERSRIVRGWVGHYELTPDHHAVIGAFPELENFICAAGFSGHGFQHSPITGMLVAELITEGRAKTEDIYPLRPTRFREDNLIHEPITAFHE